MPFDPRTTPIQRVLFPQEGDEEALGLYAHLDGEAVWSRDSVRLAPGSTISFESYFGGLPAAYWRKWTTVRDVTLTGRVEGALSLVICAADVERGRRVVESHELGSGDFALPVALDDASWLWIEATADGGESAQLSELRWCAAPGAAVTASVCITTHDRADDCAAVLMRIAGDAALDELVPAVIVVDQGSRPASGAKRWADAVSLLGDRLNWISQPNLGGSGGFSRGMLESLRGTATHVLLLDDDVALEPESIARLLAFAARTRRPAIVGAQMLSLLDRTRLHSYGERIAPRGFWWSPVAPELASVDLAAARISTTPALRRCYDVGFNGWWMCLLPREVIERLGVAVPMFIKWDDVEMGLRASAAGIPTVTLPGAALWHMPWTGKDDGLDWQAYFQLRNRLVTALLHARASHGGGVLRATFAQDLNHVLCMQYGSAAARRAAMQDVLNGPRHLVPTLAHRVGDMSELMTRAGQTVVPDADLPAVAAHPTPTRPRGRAALALRLVRVLVRQVRRPRRLPGDEVEASLAREEGKWWALGLLDSASVRSATGSGAFIGRRQRCTALALSRDAAVLHLRLWWRWNSLARDYRRRLPTLTSAATWSPLFHPDARGDVRSSITAH